MPPRITRKSDRRKVSDRTMVGTAQPLCLSASGTDGRRYDSTMNLWKKKTHSVSFHYWGWTANTLCFAVAGEVFVLTSPFIERDYRNVASLLATVLLPRRLLLKDQRRPTDSFRLEVDRHLDTVGDPDEGNAAVHPVVLTVEGHCPLNLA